MADIFELSDDEFLEKGAEEFEQASQEPTEDVQQEDITEQVEEEVAQEAVAEEKTEPENESEGVGVPQEDSEPSVEDTEAQEEEPDYEELYKRVIAPFKANGREVTPQSVEEVIQLMQMGANYTRKMQDIAPYRKVLTMLQNNELLDEDKLSFLIDLNKKDKVAIQKLLKDAELDPLDIDTSEEVNYVAGNHRVSNEEVALNGVLEDVLATPTGAETVQVISQQWDQASKEIIWKDPSIVNVINQQRANGIYDKIVSEIERQRIFGAVPYNMPFIDAYRAVGQKMNEAGMLNPEPVGRTSTTHPPKVSNNNRAKAASTTRSIPRKTNAGIDPLSLSDDEFLEFMAGRV